MGQPLPDKPEQGEGAWVAQEFGARSKRPSLPGNLGILEPEDQRLLEVSEDLETQSDAGAGFLSSRYKQGGKVLLEMKF